VILAHTVADSRQPGHLEVSGTWLRRIGTAVAASGCVLRTLVASVTTTAVLAAGCAGDRTWPSRPVALAANTFATRGEIATIDVLPLDLQLWAESGADVDLDDVRSSAEANLMGVALDTLAKRNYAVGAMIDWNGNFPGGSALSKDDLLATVGSLARYGAAAAEHPGSLPWPFLPARLGTTTGADATLYVGGWGYVTKHREVTGEQVAKGIVIGLLVITVVALIAIAFSKSSHGHGHGGGGHASGGGHGGGTAGGGATHAFTASRGVRHALHGPRITEGMVDAFGRAAVDISLASPDWGEDPALPPDGGDPKMYLEMTLVDNHTGLTLWHAHQLFPANPERADDMSRVARIMLALLPSRTGPLHTADN